MTDPAPQDLPVGASLHPWNHDFEWRLPVAEPSTLTSAQKDAFDRDGYVVIEDVLEAGSLAELRDQLDDLESQVDELLASQEAERIGIAERGAITFTVHAVERSSAARAFTLNPTLTGIACDLLGPDVNLYWDQAVYKKPEKPRRFPWHQDNGYAFVDPQHYVTCWVALTDTTVDNGCPQIVPGVHRSGTLMHEWVDPIGFECFSDPVGSVCAELGAGSMVAFSSLTPHLTAANMTTEVRKAYIVQYAIEGALRLEGDWQHRNSPSARHECNDQSRQYPVARAGKPL